MGFTVSTAQATKMLTTFDDRKVGELDIDEFANLIAAMGAFQQMDKKRNGELDQGPSRWSTSSRAWA